MYATTTMAKYRCQFVVPPAPRDPDALLYWCSDCKLVKRWNEYSKRAMCPECRSEEWCPSCKSYQIKGRAYCLPDPSEQGMNAWPMWKGFLFFYVVVLPAMLLITGSLLFITSCALHGARVCH
jgi:hypothetical protein